MKYILASEKRWHKDLINRLKLKVNAEWILIDKPSDLDWENLDQLRPDKVFIPHWSHIIPPKVFGNFECIVFHMTDLPFGRGGSPLQNLIARGFSNTRISAIKVAKEIDGGDVYLKKELSLHGTAQEIFLRATNVIEEMIIDIHKSNIIPTPQEGVVEYFKRRTFEQSTIEGILDIDRLYDHIRMLDCEGYPQAFLETEKFRFEFSRASIKDDKTIFADVRIIKK
jgi:methionyl-tRNA formyltransferase